MRALRGLALPVGAPGALQVSGPHLARPRRGGAWSLLLLGLLAGCRESPARHMSKAQDAIYEGDPQRALREYRLALDEIDQMEGTEANVLRARALKGAADVYRIEQRDVRQAIAVYRELIQQCPEAPESLEAHIILAELLRNRFRDLRGAITELTAAIARNPPQSAELSYQVAKLYFEIGDYQQCELEAQKVAARFETSPYATEALFLRGQALAMMEGRRAAARRVLEELAQRSPESEAAPHALFELGKLAADDGENEKAIEVWVRALERHPDPAVIQSSIARLRNRITNTTPAHIGKRAAAFDHLRRQAPPRSSIEAMGGTAEEAARDFGD